MARNNSISGSAAAYIRVSTVEQTEYSPESQLKIIKEYARRHSLTVSDRHIYADEGISGRVAKKRPAFMKMIEDAKRKPAPFSVILVWKYSRFARSREDSIIYKSMLKKQCGIDVVSVSEDIGGDKTSVLIEAMLEAMDEYYSLNLAEEVRRGMTEKFSRGGIITKAPFGYSVADGRLMPDGDADTVRYIFAEFTGGRTPRDIADGLNAMGKRTKKGRTFDGRNVKYILSNPTYAGYLRMKQADSHGDYYGRGASLVKGTHEAIISEEMYEAAASLLAFR